MAKSANARTRVPKTMWGRRPQAPAKGTSPFGNPETFRFAQGRRGCRILMPRLALWPPTSPKPALRKIRDQGLSRNWFLERGLGQSPTSL